MDDKEKKSYKDLIRSIRRAIYFGWTNEKSVSIMYTFLSICTSLLPYLQFASFAKIVDDIVIISKTGSGITNSLFVHGILLGVSLIFPQIVSNARGYFETLKRTRINTMLNMWFIERTINVDIGVIESSEYQTRLQNAQQWGLGSINNTNQYFTYMLADVSAVIVSSIILGSIMPKLVILAFVGSIPAYFISRSYSLELFRLWHLGTDETRIANNRRSLFFNQHSLIEIILFGLGPKLKNNISEIWKVFDTKVINAARKRSLAEIFGGLFYVVTLFISVFLVMDATLKGILLVGSLILVFNTYRGFSNTIDSLFRNIAQLEEQGRYAHRWYYLFELESPINSEKGGNVVSFNEPPIIEFKNVSFKYTKSEDYVLKNISFTIQSGEKLAIVGENGAGKTTLIRLLTRIHDPIEGEILINGINLKTFDIKSWRNILSVLFQDFSSYNMTVREAIAISKPEEKIDDEQVIRVAELTNSTDFIESFPKKYNQLLWKGFQDGVELSKGQRQRLAVARALYRNSYVTVLDEPTSSIDAIAEEKIFESIEKKMQGKTVVLISHRFSTVKNADKILVVEHGEVREFGNHKDLMQKNGRYCELYTMQANRYLEEA